MIKKKILVIDDEDVIRWSLKENLFKYGYDIVVAETGEWF